MFIIIIVIWEVDEIIIIIIYPLTSSLDVSLFSYCFATCFTKMFRSYCSAQYTFFSKMLTLVEHLVVYCLLKNYSETCVAVE